LPFSNGTMLEMFQSNVCDKGNCVNYIYDAASQSWGCTITDLHFEYGYGAEGKAKEILDKLCNGRLCSMYKRLREEVDGGLDPLKQARGQIKLIKGGVKEATPTIITAAPPTPQPKTKLGGTEVKE